MVWFDFVHRNVGWDMREIHRELLQRVAGASYVAVDYTECIVPTIGIRETINITVPLDGSMPPEFKTMIDNGASFDEMAPWLMLYSIMLHTCVLVPVVAA